MTELIVPQYIQGVSSTNTKRIPYACLVKFSGLTASSTYRYINQIVIGSDAGTNDGAGNCIFSSASGNFVRSTSVSLSTAGGYGEFTTNTSGEYSGWMITEPTGNSRFTPGNMVYMRVRINNGAGGTTVAQRFTTTSGAAVINFGSATTNGTGVRGLSDADAKSFIVLYDNAPGTGRPIAATFVEIDGTSNTTTESYVGFYSSSVNGIDGAWGTIIPNILANGVRRIERRTGNPGALIGSATDSDGLWPSGGNTVNPNSGEIAITLTGEDNSLSVSLTLFTARPSGNSVALAWSTESEIENMGFTICRMSKVESGKLDNGYEVIASFVDVPALAGHGSTTQAYSYRYTDGSVQPGATYTYLLSDISYDGVEKKHTDKAVTVTIPEGTAAITGKFALSSPYPNPFNAQFIIPLTLKEPLPVEITLCDVSGRVVKFVLNQPIAAGDYHLSVNAGDLHSGAYFVRITVGSSTRVEKIVLMR